MNAESRPLPTDSRMTVTVEGDATIVWLRTALEETDHRKTKYGLLFFVVPWSLGEALGVWALLSGVYNNHKPGYYFLIVWLTFMSATLALLLWFFLLTLRPYRPWRFVVSNDELTFYQGSEASYPFFGWAAGGLGFYLQDLFRRIKPIQIKRSEASHVETREKVSEYVRQHWDLVFGDEDLVLPLPAGISDAEANWLVDLISQWQRHPASR